MRHLLTLASCMSGALMPMLSGATAKPSPWYDKLEKSPLTPAPKVFGPVWAALYTSMGLAHYLYNTAGGADDRDKKVGNTLYAMQLSLNSAWSQLFFKRQSPRLALVDSVLMWMTILLTISSFMRKSRVAGVMLVPYLLWVTFATYLNFEICRRNDS